MQKTTKQRTSKSRLAVDREFMKIISAAGPGQAKAGRADGRRADDFERLYNDFHRFLQNMTKLNKMGLSLFCQMFASFVFDLNSWTIFFGRLK